MATPDLDLVVAAFGGNYSEAAGRKTSSDLIPQYVLPAILPRLSNSCPERVRDSECEARAEIVSLGHECRR
jgi:hypothetical protein